MSSGVYFIVCHRNGFSYCGSSNGVDSRLQSHKNALRKGKHHCKALQMDFHKYGEDSFFFVHLFPIRAEEEYRTLEATLIKQLVECGSCYNSQLRQEDIVRAEEVPMLPTELKPIVEANGGPENLANLVGVKTRIVYYWLAGKRRMSQPTAKLIRSLNPPKQETAA